MSVPDCLTCGACCTNPQENRDEGFRDWVEIEPGEVILKRKVAQKLVVRNADGVPHLRLDGDRCAALRGKLGQRVLCSVYEIRPRACRRVEAGSERCHQYRRERNIE